MEIKEVKRGIEKLQEGLSILSSGPASYYLDALLASYDLLMSRYSPWKVGDRVALRSAPDFSDAPGWMTCRHFLVAGSTGTVKSAICGKKGFQFGVEFDADTTAPKFIFRFGEHQLSSAPNLGY